MKQAVYFYRENDYNVPIAVVYYDDVKMALTLTEEVAERLKTNHPQCEDNLYVLAEGMVFKLKYWAVEM